MKPAITRFVCRCLIASMIVLPLQAQAGMIGTDQALSAAQATVAAYVSRADVAAQLQFFGLSPEAAKVRVAALTDAEVADLAGRIDTVPAGAALIGIIAFLLVFYYLIIVPTTTEKAPPATGKAKPAPAPEKK